MQPASLDASPGPIHITAVTRFGCGFLLAATLVAAADGLGAQCADGTPPPCRRPAPAGSRRPAAAVIDSATALVAPLSPVGADTALRRLAATFAAVIAENLTVGDVRARVADDLVPLRVDQRPQYAARVRAGAVIDGTLLKIGTSVRAALRLRDAKTAEELARVTVEGSPDSLLTLADRASAVLLAAWWRRQPGPYDRGGIVTPSLPALRYYITAMASWRRGSDDWRKLLDSAVRADPEFLAAWAWLALPATTNVAASMFGDLMPQLIAIMGGIDPDSARRALPRIVGRVSPTARQEVFRLPSLDLIATISAGAFPIPTPVEPDPYRAWDLAQPSVDHRYVVAVAARHATLAGFPDTAADRAARAALALDADCVPAWRLLFAELLDRGDSAAVRALWARRPKLDSTEVADLEQANVIRFAAPAWIAADTSGERVMTAVFLSGRWNRFHVMHAGFPAVRRAAQEQLPASMHQRFTTMMGLMQHLPALVALGFRDSARALVSNAAAALAPGAGPVGTGDQVSALAAWVPPDSALLPTIDSAAFEAIVTSNASLQRRSQGIFGGNVSGGALGLHRRLWIGGC